jgi:hypothetical protein
VAFFVAASVVALLQLLRLRERRLLPLLALFALLALAHSRDEGSAWKRRYHLLAGVAGLAQVYVLSPRHHHRPSA